MTSIPRVYSAIGAVQSELAKTGIAKDQKNSSQGYKFRGIDQVYAALAPLLSKHGLLMLPRTTDTQYREAETKAGNPLFYSTITVEYDFISIEDGSKHTIRVVGEAMDSGDKSINKALSAAYKYAAIQSFAIPTEGDNDADFTTHEVVKTYKPNPLQGSPTVAEWDSLKAIAKAANWPEGYVRMWIENRKKEGRSLRQIYEGALDKFSETNQREIEPDESLAIS